jgi:alkylation response protein AidB-like acyl-CoA dehydrogenase
MTEPTRFPEYADFRQEVRLFIEENLTDEMREAGRLQTSVFPHMQQAIAWQKVLHERGWAAPSWPEEFGGPGWDAIQQQIFREEAYRASAPTIALQGLTMCGPCLMGHGTKEQQDFYLPRILSGEHIWCQGYSEPGAGSDLASLTTSAVADGDDYIVNGARIRTSHAHEATHMFCLVRTSAKGKPQAGITFLLVDMSTPGITVEPIINLNGIHEQNTVFLENIRVPQANRVGAENDRWTVAKHLLEFERGSVCISPELRRNLDLIRQAAAAEKTGSGDRRGDRRVRCRSHRRHGGPEPRHRRVREDAQAARATHRQVPGAAVPDGGHVARAPAGPVDAAHGGAAAARGRLARQAVGIRIEDHGDQGFTSGRREADSDPRRHRHQR